MTQRSDGERIGGLLWTRRTRGQLDTAERKRFLSAAWPASHAAAGDDARRPLDIDAVRTPDTAAARSAERLAAQLPRVLAEHGWRAWMLGLALAERDGHDLDGEAFYIACLLHDAGLASPRPGECFTLVGADAVERAAAGARRGDAWAERAAEIVTLHINLGLDPERDAEPFYVQAGSLADLTGARLKELQPDTMSRLIADHPRHGACAELAARWEAETQAVTTGRAAAVAAVFVPAMRAACDRLDGL